MRVAVTANGPGEFAGWVRPLVAALYAREPETEVHVFCVPDDYATGLEAAYLRRLFPQAHVYDPGEYLRFAVGRNIAGVPEHVDRVQYLGGDLMHAARVHARLGGLATSYRYARRSDRGRLAAIFAVDDENRARLIREGWHPETIVVVGNLAIDGAVGEAHGAYGDPETEIARDGIVIMPGSRRGEVAGMYSFYLAVAVHLRRRLPAVPIVFAQSPFASERELDAAIRGGGHPRGWGVRGEIVRRGESVEIRAGGFAFPVTPSAMRVAAHARLAVAIPGTKLIELASIGVPSVVTIPFNAPEVVVINGPAQYLDRLPLLGVPLKRAAVLAYSRRFKFFAQPNTDAGEAILPELRGTLFPGRVAAVTADRYLDRAWCEATGERLRALYARHIGAADRMSAALLAGRPAVAAS